MRSKRIMPDEQLRLIQECRASGLSDYEWCMEHDIRPKTFYTWIYRLKKKGEIDIPATIPTVIPKEHKQPDIVKIQVEPRPTDEPVVAENSLPQQMPLATPPAQPGVPVMEVMLEGIQLRVTNEVNPQLLAQTIQYLRGFGC